MTKPYDPQDCTDCMDHYLASPFLVEACASVGIEHGRSTGQMLHSYLRQYHENGHRDSRTEAPSR